MKKCYQEWTEFFVYSMNPSLCTVQSHGRGDFLWHFFGHLHSIMCRRICWGCGCCLYWSSYCRILPGASSASTPPGSESSLFRRFFSWVSSESSPFQDFPSRQVACVMLPRFSLAVNCVCFVTENFIRGKLKLLCFRDFLSRQVALF